MQPVLTDDPYEAARWLRAGHLVIFPTETVYGLGANALSAASVSKIFAAKSRPPDNPLIVHLGAIDQIPLVARTVPPVAQQLIDAFFPGPLTIILPRNSQIPPSVAGGLDTIAVRMPSLPVTRHFLEAAALPVAAPSANISGRPSATTWEAAYEDLSSHVACVLRHTPAQTGLESTVVDCTHDPPQLLRPGAIALEEMHNIIPLLTASRKNMHRSPGTRYRHYAPQAHVILIQHPDEAPAMPTTAYIGLTPPTINPNTYGALQINRTVAEYARHLFSFFRFCEKKGVKQIYCECVSVTGLGRALMDRLHRASKNESSN